MGNQSEQDESMVNTEEEERKPLSRKLKLLTAGAIFYANITFGCAFNTYGPVATSLQNKYETDDKEISRVFTILTGSYMIGALSGGFVFNFINRQLAVILLLATMGAMMLLTPHCGTIALFFITAAVMGFCCGCYDTAQFVWMMEMMQKDCPPYVQSQHFFYALGTSVASLIMAPFLDPEEEDVTTTVLPASYEYFTFPNNNSLSINSGISANSDKDSDDKKLFVPYTIVGCMILLSVVYHLILFIFLRYHAPPPEISENSLEQLQPNSDSEVDTEKETNIGIFKWLWPWPKLRMVIFSCMVYGAYQGMEMCTFQFFSKFGQNSDLKLKESDSAYVLTGMTSAFAVGRAISIIAVFKISTQLILCGDILLTLIANPVFYLVLVFLVHILHSVLI